MSGYAKTPTVYQLEATECGAASLSMIFSYYGRHMPLMQLRVETGVSRDGCNAGNIMRCAKKYGLDCKGFRKPASALSRVSVPCIIHWDGNHFVVFEGFRGKYAYINDPAIGRRKMTPEELNAGFSGIVLTFEVTDSFEKNEQRHMLAAYVRRAVKENKGSVMLYSLLSLFSAAPLILLACLTGRLADKIFFAEDNGNTAVLAAVICVLSVAECLLLYFSDCILRRLKKRLVLFSSQGLVHKLFRLPVTFFEQRYIGDISGSIKCPSDVYSFITDRLAVAVSGIFSSAVCIAVLFYYSPYAALVALLSIVPDIIISRICMSSQADAAVRYRQASGLLAGKLAAGIGITDTVKAAGAQDAYTLAVKECAESADSSKRRLEGLRSASEILTCASKIFFSLCMLFAGILPIASGRLTYGNIISCLILFAVFSSPVKALTGISGTVNAIRAEIGRIEDITEHSPDEKYEQVKRLRNINTKLEGRVELCDVSFTYGAFGAPVVSELSVSVDCGSAVAFIGASGSGKSTVAKIISGLYKPQTGRLLLDGIDAEEIPGDVKSASIAAVSQKITLFPGSVRDNLTMWNRSISEADMLAAARDACIHEVIASKEGAYDFVLTEGARNLSGGQRQRLEIARALAGNPTVLIMDEATSALDGETERKILDNIKRRGCTCIMIAHRLSAVRNCDRIAVMDKGRIVQLGAPGELSLTEGFYKDFISGE